MAEAFHALANYFNMIDVGREYEEEARKLAFKKCYDIASELEK